jgi:hypothetical protein
VHIPQIGIAAITEIGDVPGADKGLRQRGMICENVVCV